jgi:hypothetical protein
MTNGYQERHGYDEPRGAGWVMFAGIMILIGGTLNTIGGISAIGDANFYIGDAQYQFADLNTWGWILLVTGVVQLFAAFSIWSGGAYGRWIGVISATLNAMAQLFFIPAFPLWSLALFSLDLLVIYGLVVYGGQRRPV